MSRGPRVSLIGGESGTRLLERATWKGGRSGFGITAYRGPNHVREQPVGGTRGPR